jgi:hypothetical protein
VTRKKLATKTGPSAAAKTREDHVPHVTRTALETSSSRPTGRALRPAHRKASQVIELQTAADVLAAMIHADHLDRAPNRHLTFNLQAAGIADPIVAIGKLMKLMGDGYRSHGQALSYVWVREVGPIVGEHVHILFYLPSELSEWFGRRKPGWLKRCGASRGKGHSLTRKIRGTVTVTGNTVSSPELFTVNLQNVTAYVIKHCSQDVHGVSVA